MTEQNKIEASTITKAMGVSDESYITIMCGKGDNAVDIPVKKRLSITERAVMVDDIVNMVFIDDEYISAFLNFAISYHIVTHFTNISLPSDPDEACRFLEQTNLARRIIEASPDGYIDGMLKDVREAIEYHKQKLLRKDKFDELLNDLSDLVKTIGGKVNEADLTQILEYAERTIPEYKEQIEQTTPTQTTETTATE